MDKQYTPTVVDKKATTSKYPGLTSCTLCGNSLIGKTFRVVEEGGPFDNNWFGIDQECVSKPIYANFIKNNCEIL